MCGHMRPKTLTKNVSDGGLICGMGKCATSLATSLPPFTQIRFFHRSSSRSCCYHTRYHCTGTTSTAYARGATTTPSGGTQTTTPPLPLSLSPYTRRRHCLHSRAQVKLCFFLLFFVSFLSIAETSFPPMPGSQTPPLSPVPRPSSLASPAAAIAPFAGTQVKLCLFLFFFRSFSDHSSSLTSPHCLTA